MSEPKALAVALMPAERELIISALVLVEEFDGDPALTRPVIELLEKAMTTSEAQRVAGMML